MIKLKDLILTEASSKVKRQIKNIMKYDHIDDLADYIEKFDIDKKYWRKMSMLFNRIRDEVQGRKPEGYADRYRKDLQRLLFKVIKEGKLTEGKRVQLKIPIRDRKKVVNILQKKLRLKIMKDFDYGGSKGSYFFIDLDKKFYNKVLELLMKNNIKVRG